MARVLFIDMLEGRVGMEVYDPYKRKLGVLVSFESEVDGRVTKVTVLIGPNKLKEYPAEAVEIEGDRIIVKPEWKTAAEKVRESYRRAAKRMKSLEELYHRKQIPESVYREFAKKLEKELKKLRDQMIKVKEAIKRRLHEIEVERDTLIRVQTTLRVSYFSGEIKPEAYRIAWDKLKAMEESLELERKDLEETLKRLEESFEEVTILAKHEAKKEVPEAPKLEAAQPIPVKIVG